MHGWSEYCFAQHQQPGLHKYSSIYTYYDMICIYVRSAAVYSYLYIFIQQRSFDRSVGVDGRLLLHTAVVQQSSVFEVESEVDRKCTLEYPDQQRMIRLPVA